MRPALLILALLLLQGGSECKAQYDEDYLSYDEFYQGLAPYGQWIEDPQYGYVWSPAEDGNFRPYYTNGHWVMTDYGNLWVSEYPWGWACFHYGRWTYDEYYGWLWIPGNYWGPAWVSWRVGEGFYGWAPLGPDYVAGTPVTDYYCPSDWWVFIPPSYIYHDHYYQYWNGPRGNNKHIKNTRTINNTVENGSVTYFSGPHVAQVRQVTGNPVQVFKIRNSKNQNTRLHNDEVRMYRPAHIRETPRAGGQDPLPPNVVVAPKPIRKPQAVTANPDVAPPFRKAMLEQRNNPPVTPGTNINPTAEPQRQTHRSDNNPYEWDVSRHVKQDYTPPPKEERKDPRSSPAPAKPAPPARQPTRKAGTESARPAPARGTQPAQNMEGRSAEGRR